MVEEVALDANDLDGNTVDRTHPLVDALDELLGFGDLFANVDLYLFRGAGILEHLQIFPANEKVGVLLFVMCGITRISMSEMVRNVWPYVRSIRPRIRGTAAAAKTATIKITTINSISVNALCFFMISIP